MTGRAVGVDYKNLAKMSLDVGIVSTDHKHVEVLPDIFWEKPFRNELYVCFICKS